MSWYRCPCGFVMEATPRSGGSIVSISHLHRATRLDGGSSIVRMEETPDPARECEIVCAIGGQAEDRIRSNAETPSLHPREVENSRPRGLAA